jgi:hypothetical protein
MRGPLPWLLAGAGVLVLIALGAILNDNDEGEAVSAGEWAQSVCGTVGVWRNDLEVIFEDVTQPNAQAATGEEPQSETPQGRTAYVRESLERALATTKLMVDGVDNAGIPDSPEGEEAAQRLDEWAQEAKEALEEAEDGLDDEPESIAQGVEQLTGAARAVLAVHASGAQTIVEVARVDSELGAALADASTCQELRDDEEGEA